MRPCASSNGVRVILMEDTTPIMKEMLHQRIKISQKDLFWFVVTLHSKQTNAMTTTLAVFIDNDLIIMRETLTNNSNGLHLNWWRSHLYVSVWQQQVDHNVGWQTLDVVQSLLDPPQLCCKLHPRVQLTCFADLVQNGFPEVLAIKAPQTQQFTRTLAIKCWEWITTQQTTVLVYLVRGGAVVVPFHYQTGVGKTKTLGCKLDLKSNQTLSQPLLFLNPYQPLRIFLLAKFCSQVTQIKLFWPSYAFPPRIFG